MKAPETHKIKNINILKQDDFILDNGIKVSSFHNNDLNVLKFNFAFPAGRVFQQKAFQSSICNAILREGTNAHPNSADIEEKLDYYGIFIQQRIEAYWSVVSFYVPLMHLEKALPIMHEILFDAIIDEISIEFLKEKAKARLIKSLEKTDFVAKSKAYAWFWGENHPMGFYPNINDLENLSQTDIKKFYQKHYQNAKFNLYISGNLPETLIPEINQLFGKHTIKSIEQEILIPEKQTPEIVHEKIEKQVQTSLFWIAPCISPKDKDYYDFKITNTIFGDYFGSRLMTNIREEKAYTYGIYSSINPKFSGSNITIQTDVGKEYLNDTVKQIEFEMLRIQNEPVPKKELELIKNYMLGELLGVFDGVFNHASVLRYLDEMQMDFNYYKNYIQRIQSITAKDINVAAQKYLNNNMFHKVYVG